MKEKKVEFYKNNKKIAQINCEIAKNIFEKTKGLMYREKLAKDKGMLFTFYIPWIRAFWMKNVNFPLDIIFVNRKNKIINIYEAPLENNFLKKIYFSKGFCRYVIETNINFCKENNIEKNDRIMIK